ncbi:MAG TPA: amidohydrolase [Bacilli bacterium]|jgi:amidohydrolase|nr:amidohydrolase [Bacilli bacterium]HOH61432.1 amidohydrolase [Bacilli bacterium]HPB48958.1 amidohydrolase [Bacilli bacterium]HPM15039.1 amidohydrolase [Bacilli bacterium]HPY54681.1 amidohydrolase [Bacilli bacterium]
MLENQKKYQEYAVWVRRQLHMYPEIGYEIDNTVKFISRELDKLGVKYYTGIGKSSIVAILGEKTKKPTIGFRADVDALEIEENNQIEYRSKIKGRMHACGHDVHGAILLTLIKYLVEEKVELKGQLKFIFQAAEEGPTSGGELVCQDKLMDDVDVFLAFHVDPSIAAGKIGIKFGEFNASCDDFTIKLIGKSGHAAYPHLSIDPIQMAVEVYQLIQNMKNRQLDQTQKAVISICVMEAGKAFNIIPDYAYLKGTVRTYNKEIKKKIKKQIEEIVRNVVNLHRGDYELEYRDGVIPTINTPEVCEVLKQVIVDTIGIDNYIELDTVSMGVDDFAYYVDKAKGAMMSLGVRNEEKDCIYPLHNSRFNVDEDVFIIGVEVYLKAILQYMK